MGIACYTDIDGNTLKNGDTVDVLSGMYLGRQAKVMGTSGDDLIIWPDCGVTTWIAPDKVRLRRGESVEMLTQAG